MRDVPSSREREEAGETSRSTRIRATSDRKPGSPCRGSRAAVGLLAMLLSVAPTIPALGGWTPATNGGPAGSQLLLTAGGSGTPLGLGEYVTNTALVNYIFIIEVPTGTTRLRVQLFDPDTNATTNDVGSSEFTYELFDPNFNNVANAYSSTSPGPADFDNQWWTLYDTGAGGGPQSGHWVLSLYATDGTGVNGVGVWADGADESAAPRELNVYYYSFFNYGTTGAARAYTHYPWITSGCSCAANSYAYPVTGDATFTSPTNLMTAVANVSSSDWLSNPISGRTDASNATDYGIWKLDYDLTNLDSRVTYYIDDFSAAPPPPTAQPTYTAFRVYLPTDAGAAPAKPYAEQMVRHKGGPNPPVVDQTTTFTVTVRVVNPTPYPITFSEAIGYVVTANVPGGEVLYVGDSFLSSPGSGAIISVPVDGGSGDVVWDPGNLAAGATAWMAYQVAVTPSASGTTEVTGTPASAGTTVRYLDETAYLDVNGFSVITLGPLCGLTVSTQAPTLALLAEAKASSASPGVLLEWETASEAGTAGFEIYRVQGGRKERVHAGLLEPSLSPAGARYRLHDRDARPRGPIDYEIVEVETSGARRSHGLVRYDPGERAERGAEAPAEGYAVRARSPETPGSASVTLAAEASFAATGAAEKAALRIETSGEGLTLLPWADLAGAIGIQARTLQGYTAGGMFALRRHDGSAAAWTATADGLLFWAQPFDSLFARGSVYRLTLERGSTMPTVRVPASALSTRPAESFRERLHVEEDAVGVVALPVDTDADYWLWKAVVAGRPGTEQATFALPVRGLAAGSAQLAVGLQGASAAALGRHHVRVLVNGIPVGETELAGYERRDATFDLPARALVEGKNAVTVEALLDAGTSQSIVYVDSFDVAYPRRYDALGSPSFVFEALPSRPVAISGLPAGAVALVDVTDPATPALLTGFTLSAGELRFVAPSRGSRFAISVGGAAARPVEIGAVEPLDLTPSARSGASYLVVTSAGLREPANRLAALRSAQGLSTRVVTFQSIADELAGGVRDPEAIRWFLERAYASWRTKPRYVVLAGAGSYDYRGLAGYGPNHVPALLHSSGGGLFPADRDFATTDAGDFLPISVGRIPARTAAELDAVVDKVAAYERADASAAWAGRAVFLADDPEAGMDFGAASDAAEGRLGLAMTKERLHLGPLPAEVIRTTLRERFAEGFGLLSYFGHAGIDRLASEKLLTSGDVTAFTPTEGTPLVLALTCVLNRFGVPGYTSLGETLTNRAEAGAVAVWSSSGLSDQANAAALARHAFGALSADREIRLGDAVQKAAGAYIEGGGAPSTLAFYNLLGDPALLVKQPPATPASAPRPVSRR